MQIQWFPGHMTKTKRLIAARIKLVDVVIELTDARLPQSSRNPLLDSLIGEKARIVVLNKEDLADPQQTARWVKYWNEQGNCRALAFNSTMGKKKLIAELKENLLSLTEAKRNRLAAKGVKMQNIRCMIVGIPNVGKSTFINILVGKKSAKVGDKPGVTRGEQWIKLEDGIELLDTPGILWPKFEDQKVGLRLALIGSIRDEILNTDELAVELIRFLKTQYPGILTERYEVEETQKETELLCGIAENRKCITKGGELDYSKAAALLIDEFRSGKLGKVTLEWPKEQENG